ncbi:MAG: lamin tail domain-containing protein, partial [Gallionella sp.]|nr:lamin tail domain-containing protein [Gallionella sp.]
MDISNWQVLDKEEQIKITMPTNTKILAGGFLLLERTDDNSAPNVKADIIYTGALSNSNEALRLFDDKCGLIDEVFANSEWPAGETGTKRTMERQADMGWWTYNGAGEGSGDALILGTPKKENMVKVVYYGGGGGGGAVTAVVVETNNNLNTQPSKILISEVQITGGTGKTDNDFIELYNSNDSRVNLKGYRLVKRTKTGTTDTSIKSWTDNAYIEAKSFYLWANSEYTDISVAPDITTSGSLANDNGVALRFGAEDTGTIIDSAAWGAAENSFIGTGVFSQNPGVGQGIQRIRSTSSGQEIFIDTDNNAADFEIQNCPSPKAQSASCQSAAADTNQAPSAFFVFSTTTPKTGEEIIFNAASSTDPDGNIALYDWNFGDNQLASSTQATTTHSYLLAGNYNASLTVFDNLNATSTYILPLLVASSTIQQDEELRHILISEIMPSAGEGKSDEEFVELYNPNNTAVDLTGYSLRKKTSAATTSSTPLVSAINFSGKIIPAKGFLLISSLNYSASSTADLIYSSASYGLASDNDQAVFLRNSVGETADEVYYVSISDGKSLERKALSSSICVSAQGVGEFLGNGCDADNLNDFEIRNTPNPQNKNNFSEPRTKPATVINFMGAYDKPNKKINLSWNASQDYSGATSTLSYLVSDISINPILGSITISSTTAEFNISEIGRDYVFEIKAADKEGLGSDIATTTVSVPNTSIEDVNYFILNQTETSGTMGLSDRIFKPLATGVIDLMAFNVGVSYN